MAMGFALVYLGEHYVVDLVAGIVYALAVHVGMNRWERRRAVRETQRDRGQLVTADGTPLRTAEADGVRP